MKKVAEFERLKVWLSADMEYMVFAAVVITKENETIIMKAERKIHLVL